MTDTALERAARALCEAQGVRLSQNELARCAGEVRAVLQAIREPGEGAISAGRDDGRAFIAPEAVANCFTAIIDHILDEGDQK